MTARILSVFLVALLLACRPRDSPSAPEGSAYPGTLVDPALHPHDYMLRQHAVGRYGERRLSFDAVVQKTHGKLLVLLLTPYGGRALLVEQNGLEVETTKFIDRELPFEPEFILLDVQRVFIKGHPARTPPNGWVERKMDGELVRERWQDGKLFERDFSRLDGKPAGTISIRFEGGFVPGTEPPPITFHNGWFGYTLRFETSDYHPL